MGCGSEIVFACYGLGFLSPHLEMPGLDQVFKITTDGYCIFCVAKELR
jgi:hypothetical protein